MLKLEQLAALNKDRKRVGRGGSRGGQSGKGHKGQRARTGSRSELKPFFEGGQMSLSRRLPRRGFTNIHKQVYEVVNLRDLEARFSAGEHVNVLSLREKNLLKGNGRTLVKILGNGSLTKALTVEADAFSVSAENAIKGAQGTVIVKQEIVSDRTAA